MPRERQITEHLERALVETMFAIAEFDHMRAQAQKRGEPCCQDSLGGMLLLLRSALDSALTLTRTLNADYALAGPDSSR